MSFRFFWISIFFSLASTTNAAVFLDSFRTQTKTAMDAPVVKFGAPLNQRALDGKIDACRQFDSRAAIMKAAGLDLAPRTPSDRARLRAFSESNFQAAKDFLELKDVYGDIQTLDQYRTAVIDVQPWSGDYWAIYSGITAKRYQDPNFPLSTWKEAFDYFIANPPAKVAAELLAPSEKYDRLVGDRNYTLTQVSWQEGKQYNDQFNDVEKWMGICHGWAPAAFMEPRPTHTVEFEAYRPVGVTEAQKITFKPDDLKALASLKWANGVTVKPSDLTNATRFVGGRCNTKDPARDPDTGRIIDADCFDLNPGLWHIIVINQIAREKRSFVIDANFDYEVWNQPVSGFRLTYFNPKTLANTDNLAEARVRLDDPEFVDKFKKFRLNNKAVEVVGVRMNVSYVVETSPQGRDEDSIDYDSVRTAQYHYDLELDANGNIVGGEWYQNRHPDFIWMPMKESTALNVEDVYLQNEDQIVYFAPEASKSRVPMRFVLNKLLNAAKAQ